MRTNQDIGGERERGRERRESESKGLGLETAVDSIMAVKLLLSEFKNRAWQGFLYLTYRRFSSRATGRAKMKIILSVSPVFSLFVRGRLLAEETSVKWEKIALLFFPHRSRRSEVSILPSITSLTTSRISCFHPSSCPTCSSPCTPTMVNYPSFRQFDQPLIPTSSSLTVQNLKIKDQRGSYRPILWRNRCIVRPFCLPPPSRPAADPVSFLCSVKDAKRYLEKHKRIENAIDAYYNEGGGSSSSRTTPSGPDPATLTQRLEQMYNTYKGMFSRSSSLRSSSCHLLTDPDGDEINVGGTLEWCKDLGVDPEDVVLLPIAYELKSPSVGSFPRKFWIDGWKSLGCDSISSMQTALPKLRDKLANDPTYFTSVYNYTFEFAKTGAQRSIAVDDAIAFWGLLIPHGLTGTALAHTSSVEEDDSDDESMDTEEGWKPEFTGWWFDFLTTRGGKGVSKDTWTMVSPTFPSLPLLLSKGIPLCLQFLDFVRTIDSEFQNHDYECEFVCSDPRRVSLLISF